MDKFFLVLSNLKHNGELYEAGSVIEGDLEAFGEFITAGVLRVVEGAESLEQAAELATKQVADALEKAKAAEAAKPKDTWAPSEPEAPAADGETVAGTETAPEGTQTTETTETTTEAAKPTEEAKTETQAPVVGTGDLPPADAAANL
jgi:hypothetical protein